MVTKADLVKEGIEENIRLAIECEDEDEVTRLEAELAYLETHRREY